MVGRLVGGAIVLIGRLKESEESLLHPSGILLYCLEPGVQESKTVPYLLNERGP